MDVPIVAVVLLGVLSFLGIVIILSCIGSKNTEILFIGFLALALSNLFFIVISVMAIKSGGYVEGIDSLKVNLVYEVANRFENSQGEEMVILIEPDGKYRFFKLSAKMPDGKFLKVVFKDHKKMLAPFGK